MRESKPGARRGFPDGWAEAARRHRQIHAFGERVEATARAYGLTDLQREMARRRTASREAHLHLVDWLHSHRREHAPLPRRALPRARATRARSASRTGSSSASAGADPPPGGDDDKSEPGSPGSWLNFAASHRLTPGCSGTKRLAHFSLLSDGEQDRIWRALAREIKDAGA